MRKFRFPLEGVSRVRSITVREREVALARAREELLRAEGTRMERERELRRSMQAAPRGAVLPVHQLLEHDAELRRLRQKLWREEGHRNDRAAVTEMEREQLVEARRREKAVEKLRERRYLEFVSSLLREEQKMTDEVASRREREKRAA